MADNKKWIQEAIKEEGALRRTAGVKEGETIPLSTLHRLAKQKGVTGQRAKLALNLREMRKS
jgi:hypothetical protein